MWVSTPFDPAAVIAQFIDNVAPFDPSPGADPVAMVGVRTALGEGVFAVSDHVIRAMCRALESYHDPEDRGAGWLRGEAALRRGSGPG